MDKLWAPWRSKYIYDRKRKRCIFCIPKKKNELKDDQRFIIERSSGCFSILNIYPYNNGHVMIAPYEHTGTLDQLKDEVLLDMMRLCVRTKKVLDDILKPHGYNIGLNLGKSAGAGFDCHVHMHIVPRWNGDTNFMPALGNTKVISEHLSVLYRTMKDKS